jgi:hypothetical protein
MDSYACIKENDYISPIHLWIEEACNNIGQPWHAFVLLLHDHDPTLFLAKESDGDPIAYVPLDP